jgi:hypothetical protein
MYDTKSVGPTTQTLSFDGRVLTRGFWLYVWEVTAPNGSVLLYVGRTGDSSSSNAQSPFVRMGQHLGFFKNSSMLRNHLGQRAVDPDECTFRLVAHGPVLDEAADQETHKHRRDIIAAVEKQLAEDLAAAGYTIMNEVRSRMPLDRVLYQSVQQAFAVEFPRLLLAQAGELDPSRVAANSGR